MAQGDKKNMSVAGDISGTIYHMIVIYGALMQNDDVSSVFFFFLFFIFSKHKHTWYDRQLWYTNVK